MQGLVPTRDGAYVLVRAATQPEDAKQTIVPDWVTDGYTRDLTERTKVGDAQGRSRAGILETATVGIEWVDVEQRARIARYSGFCAVNNTAFTP